MSDAIKDIAKDKVSHLIRGDNAKLLSFDHPTRKIYEKASPAIVKISCPYGIGTGAFHIGSGFFIDKEGRIATAKHVIEDATISGDIKIETADGKTTKAKIEKVDFNNDLAILKVENIDGINPLSVGRSKDLQKDATVHLLGHPLGHPQVFVSTGKFNSFVDRQPLIADYILKWSGFPHGRYAYADIDARPGDSGGPLLDNDGKVIGVMSLGTFIPKHVQAFHVQAEKLEHLINSDDPQYQPEHANRGTQLANFFLESVQNDPKTIVIETAGFGLLATLMLSTKKPPFTPPLTCLAGTITGLVDLSALQSQRSPYNIARQSLNVGADLVVALGGLGCTLLKRNARSAAVLAAAGIVGRLTTEFMPKYKSATEVAKRI